MARSSKNYYNESGTTMEFERKIYESPIGMETNGPETKNGIVINTSLVKVRKEPNFESDVLEVLRKGDKVTILDTSWGSEFYKVSTNKIRMGYIAKDFIKED